MKKCFLQHAENGVNTHVFARHEPKNTVNTCKYYDFCYQRKNIVNTVVLDFRGEKKHPYLQCFLNAKTPPIWWFSATARLRKKLQGQQQQQQPPPPPPRRRPRPRPRPRPRRRPRLQLLLLLLLLLLQEEEEQQGQQEQEQQEQEEQAQKTRQKDVW